MNKSSGTRRRDILRIGALGVSGAAATALAGCGETQIVEREVVKVVTQEVPVERVVTQIVEREKIVERIVTQEAPPQLKRVDLTLLYNQFGTPEMWRAVFKKLEQENPTWSFGRQPCPTLVPSRRCSRRWRRRRPRYGERDSLVAGHIR